MYLIKSPKKVTNPPRKIKIIPSKKSLTITITPPLRIPIPRFTNLSEISFRLKFMKIENNVTKANSMAITFKK